MRVVRHWHKLPRDIVAASSLEMFEARLDGAGVPAHGGGVGTI